MCLCTQLVHSIDNRNANTAMPLITTINESNNHKRQQQRQRQCSTDKIKKMPTPTREKQQIQVKIPSTAIDTSYVGSKYREVTAG